MCLKVQVYQCIHPSGVQLRSYIVIMGLIFTFGTLAWVGACSKEMENTVRNLLDVLHLGHLLRRPARASKLSWKRNPCQVRVCLGVQEHQALNWTPRLHTSSDLDVQDMYGKLTRRPFQGLYFESQIYPVDINCLNNLTSRICPDAVTLSFGLWALYHVGAH